MAVKFTIDPVPEPKPAKSIFKSKTFWVNLISFGLAIIPEVQAFAEGTLSPENGAVVKHGVTWFGWSGHYSSRWPSRWSRHPTNTKV
jgi:hypothetical protein